MKSINGASVVDDQLYVQPLIDPTVIIHLKAKKPVPNQAVRHPSH